MKVKYVGTITRLYNFAGLAALCIIIAISQDWKWKDLGVDQSEHRVPEFGQSETQALFGPIRAQL